MKKRNFLFLIFIIALYSCSSSNGELQGEDEKTKKEARIILMLDKNAVFADNKDVVKLSVLNENSIDVTGKCKFNVNGSFYAGNEFKTDVPGEYKIYAYINELKSNELVINAIDRTVSGYKLFSSKQKIFADGGDLAFLTLLDKNNKDVTSVAKFYSENQLLSSPVFSTNAIGKHIIKAKVGDAFADGELEIMASNDMKLPYRLFVEYFTSIRCKYCPIAAHNLSNVKSELKDKIIIVSSHENILGNDRLANPDSETLGNIFNTKRSLPCIIANRKGNSYYQQESKLANLLLDEAKFGISIETKIETSIVKVKTRVGAKEDYNNLYCSIMLIEDNVVAGQLDYEKGYIPSYSHKRVLRKSNPTVKTNKLGHKIDLLKKGNAITFEGEFSITNFNVDNCYIVVVLGSNSLQAVRAVQEVKVGKSVGY